MWRVASLRGRAQHQEVRTREEVDSPDELDRDVGNTPRVRRPCVGHDLHAEAVSRAGEVAADRAEPRDAERLAAQLHRRRALPRLLAPHPGVPGEEQHHEERVLGDRAPSRILDVGHHDTARGGRPHIDVVDAGPGLRDHAQPRRQRHHLVGDRRVRSQDRLGIVRDPAACLRARSPEDPHLVLAAGPRRVYAELRCHEQWVDDEQVGHGLPVSSHRSPPAGNHEADTLRHHHGRHRGHRLRLVHARCREGAGAPRPVGIDGGAHAR